MRVVEAWIHLHSFAQLRDRLGVVMCIQEYRPHVGIDDDRERVELESVLNFGDGFVKVLLRSKAAFGIPLMSGGVVGIQFNGTPEFAIGGGDVKIVGKG